MATRCADERVLTVARQHDVGAEAAAVPVDGGSLPRRATPEPAWRVVERAGRPVPREPLRGVFVLEVDRALVAPGMVVARRFAGARGGRATSTARVVARDRAVGRVIVTASPSSANVAEREQQSRLAACGEHESRSRRRRCRTRRSPAMPSARDLSGDDALALHRLHRITPQLAHFEPHVPTLGRGPMRHTVSDAVDSRVAGGSADRAPSTRSTDLPCVRRTDPTFCRRFRARPQRSGRKGLL